jgi:hypothetical protein
MSRLRRFPENRHRFCFAEPKGHSKLVSNGLANDISEVLDGGTWDLAFASPFISSIASI